MKRELEASYRYAVKIMRERAVSFYHAFSRLPKNRFKAVAAVYAFCRTADDISDEEEAEENIAEKEKKLEDLEKALSHVYSSNPVVSRYSWWPAFEDAVKRFNIPPKGFLDQLEGQKMDIHFRDIPNLDELILYCRYVAGSVGQMLLPMLANGTPEPEMTKACIDLGTGMQVTNILRDVGEDLRKRDRIYLPMDMLEEYDITRNELKILSTGEKADIPDGFIQAWERLASIADGYYSKYLEYLDGFIPECRLPIVSAALNYHAIAQAVRDNGYDCFTKRCYTTKKERSKLLKEAKKLV